MGQFPFEEFSEETLTNLHEWAYHYGLSLDEVAEIRGISLDELLTSFQSGFLKNE
ncbi:MAG: hypothetical protein ACI35O_14970 [Bacillaceae bacterium]